jgi:hypothetical protein
VWKREGNGLDAQYLEGSFKDSSAVLGSGVNDLQWNEVTRMSAPQDKLTEVVSVRFTASEVEHLRTVAEGRPLSHVVRELSLHAARGRPVNTRGFSQTTQRTDLLSIKTNTPDWSAPETSNVVQVIAGPRRSRT